MLTLTRTLAPSCLPASLGNPTLEGMTNAIVEAVRIAGVKAILAKGWSGRSAANTANAAGAAAAPPRTVRSPELDGRLSVRGPAPDSHSGVRAWVHMAHCSTPTTFSR